MALFGNIIKGMIEFKDFITSDIDPVEAQEKVLTELLSKAKDTEFGKKYDFSSILKSEDIPKSFSEKVPYFDYNKMNKEWWNKYHDGEENITWPGKPKFFALSSGTTGKSSKRIPVTDEMLDAIKQAGIRQITSLSNFDFEADLFEKEIMMLGSSSNLQEHNDFLEGEISGISTKNIPFWFKGYYKPGDEISNIDDWDERVEAIAKNAKEWDIGAISGIPTWIELMIKKVIEYHEVEHIHEVWPNFEVYTSGGVAFKAYEKSFNALLGHPITVIDTYFASEGFIASQTRPETDAMQLLLDNGIYFEFVPFKADYIQEDGSLVPDAPVIPLKEVELDQEYVLIISTVSGAWRYEIGDTIEFTNIEKAEIKITGRTKFFLNTVGSQLSVNKMDDAMNQLEDEYKTEISEYLVCAKRADDGEFYHHWYIGSEDSLDTEKVSKTLDKFFKQSNKNYKVARSKALKGLKVKIVSNDIFYEWSNQNKKKGGQVKMEKVMSEEKFEEWEKFVNGES
ncbi:GH3 family domain-containing protein [Brumimicrobium aurantiacum]|uniref:GH3 auxin-responsive promoter n=1 Tax=Brumimicrobium aurantiacum TaxID=1737063 RepID=A0A3E1EXZ7_9FLAO|nr:GH3 auxin-responsive promoter family protein [Brumimicrobium aurantiacum]RFC54435.1 GH3 auxin-responsive promoter [Brumimicrobium aurantiacum]